MYRIPILCVTACLAILGCGGPSASDLYELEKRVSASEKAREGGADSLSDVSSKTESLVEQVESVRTTLDQRLTKLESELSQIKNQLKDSASEDVDRDPFEPARLTKAENQIAELEAKIADLIVNRENSRQPIGDRGVAPDNVSEMANDSITKDVPPQKGSAKNKMRAGRFEMTLLSWNVESEGNDPNVIAKQLSEMNRYDVYGLCEVLPESIELYTDAVGEDYRTIATRSGFNDRLQIIYNEKKFELLRRLELKEINFEYRYRSPLVAHLKHRATGQQIMVLNNHLARGRAEVRTRQAEQLVEWARNQNVPIVAVGDYNFDYVFSTRKGNDGFVAMMRDNIWQWVEPVELIDTNWFDNPKNPDGVDDYPGSMLDFAFVAGAATTWKNECRVIVRPGDFPDDESTSDHRPFELRLSTK